MAQEISSFNELETQMKLAEVMCTGKVMIPEHLRNSSGDCLAVIMQAAQWRMNPFVVAQKTFLIKGKLGYEAQLVAAVINTNAPINGRINYEYLGDWDKFLAMPSAARKEKESGLAVKASVITKDGVKVEKTVYLSTITTRNSTNWETDPQQQLSYQAAVRLARQHFPEVLLGVYIPDELEGIEVTPVNISQKTLGELSSAVSSVGINLSYENGKAVAKGNTHSNAKLLKGLGFTVVNEEWIAPCADDRPTSSQPQNALPASEFTTEVVEKAGKSYEVVTCVGAKTEEDLTSLGYTKGKTGNWGREIVKEESLF